MRSSGMLSVVLGAIVLQACSATASGDGSGTGTGPGSSGSSGDIENGFPNGATRAPPTVTNVSPLEGDYGTVVTVTGDNLDEASAKLVLQGSVAAVEIRKPTASNPNASPSELVVSWSKTEIKFRYPFPAEGKVNVSTKSGEAGGASFAPTYRPGTPLSGAFTRRELLSVVSPSPGTLVAAFDGETGPYVLTADANGVIKSEAFMRSAPGLHTMSLYVTAGGAVEGVFEEGGLLKQLTDAMGTPTITSTGVTAVDAAGGNDATGPYAWIRKGNGQIVRVRPPSWTEVGSPVTDPTPGSAPGPSMAVAPDQSLFVGWGVNDSGSFPLYDEEAYPMVRRLRDGQTTFDAVRTAGGGQDDKMMWTRFRPGPEGRVASYYCASDTGLFESPSVDCGEGYLGVGASSPLSPTGTNYVVGYDATKAMAASCDLATATMRVGPEGDTAAQKAVLFPCPQIIAVTVDAGGAPVVLVKAGSYLYVPHKR